MNNLKSEIKLNALTNNFGKRPVKSIVHSNIIKTFFPHLTT